MEVSIIAGQHVHGIITTNLVFCIATIHKSNIHSPHSSIQRINAH